MSRIRAVVVDPDARNRLVLADVEEPSPTPSEALAAVSLNRGAGLHRKGGPPGRQGGRFANRTCLQTALVEVCGTARVAVLLEEA
jgi:hypothetical protein